MIKHPVRINLTFDLEVEARDKESAYERLRELFMQNNNLRLQRNEVEFLWPEIKKNENPAEEKVNDIIQEEKAEVKEENKS